MAAHYLLEDVDVSDTHPQQRRHCYCGAFLSKQPNTEPVVECWVVEWKPDEEGFLYPDRRPASHHEVADPDVKTECEVSGPWWTCKRCGATFDPGDMFL